MNKRSLCLRHPFLLLCCAFALFSPVTAHAEWTGKQDNKPIAELELMDDAELADIAHQACRNGAIAMQTKELQKYGEASDYLTTIALVSRKAHHGTTPQWMQSMKLALLAQDDGRCSDIWTQANKDILDRKIMEKTAKAAAAKAAAVAEAAKAHAEYLDIVAKVSGTQASLTAAHEARLAAINAEEAARIAAVHAQAVMNEAQTRQPPKAKRRAQQ